MQLDCCVFAGEGRAGAPGWSDFTSAPLDLIFKQYAQMVHVGSFVLGGQFKDANPTFIH